MSANFAAFIEQSAFRPPMVDPIARIERERAGMPAKTAETLRKNMGVSVSQFSRLLGIAEATFKKKVADGEPLTGRYGDAVADLGEILATVRGVLSPEQQDFDVSRWFAEWILIPQPSLDGRNPADILDTPTGRQLVKRLVGAFGSGAYL
ncbi:MAG: antitoxin Xre-like helix-turn-helix domain-containing protein [Rhodanobacteraceae bacterium]